MALGHRNMLLEDEWAYARRFHPNSPDYSDDRFGGYNQMLREVLDPGMFLAVRETNRGPLFEIWWVTDKYAIPPAAQKFAYHTDANGYPLPLSPLFIRNVLHSRRDIWKDESERLRELDRLEAQWDEAHRAKKEAILAEGREEMAEINRHLARAPIFSGGGVNQ